MQEVGEEVLQIGHHSSKEVTASSGQLSAGSPATGGAVVEVGAVVHKVQIVLDHKSQVDHRVHFPILVQVVGALPKVNLYQGDYSFLVK
jgi:hypothetical protein